MKLLSASFLLFSFANIHAQIDQGKLDSLSRSIDSSAQVYRKQQEEIIKNRESTYRNEVKKALQNDSSARNVLAEQERKGAKERQEITARILTGVLLLFLAVIALVRIKKRKS